MHAVPSSHALTVAPVNGGNYLVSPGTAASVSLMCRLPLPPSPLPCHKVEPRPFAAHASLHALFENACQGLSVTPEQLQQELTDSCDILDLVSGVLARQALRLTARTLALRSSTNIPEFGPSCRSGATIL